MASKALSQDEYASVCHSENEWVLDDDDNGIRGNTSTPLRECGQQYETSSAQCVVTNKIYLSDYISMCEYNKNLKKDYTFFNLKFDRYALNFDIAENVNLHK